MVEVYKERARAKKREQAETGPDRQVAVRGPRAGGAVERRDDGALEVLAYFRRGDPR